MTDAVKGGAKSEVGPGGDAGVPPLSMPPSPKTGQIQTPTSKAAGTSSKAITPVTAKSPKTPSTPVSTPSKIAIVAQTKIPASPVSVSREVSPMSQMVTAKTNSASAVKSASISQSVIAQKGAIPARREEWSAGVAIQVSEGGRSSDWRQMVAGGKQTQMPQAFMKDGSRAQFSIGQTSSQSIKGTKEYSACKTSEERERHIQDALHTASAKFIKEAFMRSGNSQPLSDTACDQLRYQIESMANQNLFDFDSVLVNPPPAPQPQLLNAVAMQYIATGERFPPSHLSRSLDVRALGLTHLNDIAEQNPQYEIVQRGDKLVICGICKFVIYDLDNKPVGFEAMKVEIEIDLKKLDPSKLLCDQPDVVTGKMETTGTQPLFARCRFADWDATTAAERFCNKEKLPWRSLLKKTEEELLKEIPTQFSVDSGRMKIKVGDFSPHKDLPKLPKEKNDDEKAKEAEDNFRNQMLTYQLTNQLNVKCTAIELQALRYQVQDLATQRLFGLHDSLAKESIFDRHRAAGYEVTDFGKLKQAMKDPLLAIGFDMTNERHLDAVLPQMEVIVEGNSLVIRGEKKFIVNKPDKDGTPVPIGMDALKVEIKIDLSKYDPTKLLFEQAEGVVKGTSDLLGMKTKWNQVPAVW